MKRKDIKGTQEAVVYSTVKKNEEEGWHIIYRCKNCDRAAHESLIDILQFSWDEWKLGKDQKVRICHHCDKDSWYYSTVIIKGKNNESRRY